MQKISEPVSAPPETSQTQAQIARLNELVASAGNLLPISGPVSAFVFLNALQGLEDLPFDEGMKQGARLFGCQPYLIEDRYREYLDRGRIRRDDLLAVLTDELRADGAETIAGLSTRLELRLAMLEYPIMAGPAAELRWFVAETDALTRVRADAPDGTRERLIEETRRWVMRDLRNGHSEGEAPASGVRDHRSQHLLADLIQRFGMKSIETWSLATWESLALQALWRICREGVHGAAAPAVAPPNLVRHRDIVLDATGEDSDALVNPIMIRYCAAYADQGFARWPLPFREQGFYRAFCVLYSQTGGPPDQWMEGLPEELVRLRQSGIDARHSVLESLELLGVPENQWDEFIILSILNFRGWASLIYQMEIRSDRVPLPAPPGTLIEFLAVRLILERIALAYTGRKHLNFDGPLDELRSTARAQAARHVPRSVEQRAFPIFQLAQVLGWQPETLFHLSKKEWGTLLTEVERFSGLERRRLLHAAYERRFRIQTLDALSIHGRRPVESIKKPRFQAVFCIDTREESFRRYLEEIAPDTETFAAAGFYGVPMYYKGVADAHYAALCPIVVFPRHWVVEEPIYTEEEKSNRRAKARKALGAASHRFHVGSRSFAPGALLAGGLGVLASIPLVARVLLPRLTARVRRTVGWFVEPPPLTRLRLERTAPDPGPEGEHIGYSLEEMANIGERMLREMGFTSYSRLIIFFGHGSFCLNNPHKSSYDCGACSGSPGGANARALAMILNDPRVRTILRGRGLLIPEDSWFQGALHNTAEDAMTFYDLDLLPVSHIPDIKAARSTLEQVCERNAHERCRRFYSAPLNLSYAAALRHVEGRAEDIAQTRPEFGNCTNAICIVARRARTRGLYLDRRSFLVSYNPLQDDDVTTVLARILGAVVPVCEGINMMYNLSFIDSNGYGAGTKLPHNVASLQGIMDGPASDLRLGLPWQGVEIHEPMRCLFVIETTPEKIVSIMNRNPVVGRILRNGWAQLALLSPDSAEIQVYRNNQFEPYTPEITELPKAPSSFDWYRGWREHLGFAVIERTPS